MDDDALQREVAQPARALNDLKRQLKHETERRGLYGKISRVEAIGMLWVALPIVFCVMELLAVALVMSKPQP